MKKLFIAALLMTASVVAPPAHAIHPLSYPYVQFLFHSTTLTINGPNHVRFASAVGRKRVIDGRPYFDLRHRVHDEIDLPSGKQRSRIDAHIFSFVPFDTPYLFPLTGTQYFEGGGSRDFEVIADVFQDPHAPYVYVRYTIPQDNERPVDVSYRITLKLAELRPVNRKALLKNGEFGISQWPANRNPNR